MSIDIDPMKRKVRCNVFEVEEKRREKVFFLINNVNYSPVKIKIYIYTFFHFNYD